MFKSKNRKSLYLFLGLFLMATTANAAAQSDRRSDKNHQNNNRGHNSTKQYSNYGHQKNNSGHNNSKQYSNYGNQNNNRGHNSSTRHSNYGRNYSNGYSNSNHHYNYGGYNSSYRNNYSVGQRRSLLPLGYLALSLAGLNYYYHSGSYYQRVGHQYAVIRPPLGIGISILPAGYRTHHYGRHNYYSANGIFYQWDDGRRNYLVINNPEPLVGITTNATTVSEQFVYPRQGQSNTQTSRDQYECYLWAVDHTGVEPSQINDPGSINNVDDYQRANGACLEARGYSVK
ncbi:MAG: hypothetical protein ACI909_003017 [Planctomycetota bacterium]|jgi:hypothetical protein